MGNCAYFFTQEDVQTANNVTINNNIISTINLYLHFIQEIFGRSEKDACIEYNQSMPKLNESLLELQTIHVSKLLKQMYEYITEYGLKKTTSG